MYLPDIKRSFGAAIRFRRKGMGFSQEELAERAGLHRTYVADVERGARNLSLANIERLAVALETSLPKLFLEVDPNGDKASPGAMVDILLVEDEPADVELTIRALKSAGLANSIDVVRDGEEALSYLMANGTNPKTKVHSPKLILLDLQLPKLSGLEVLRRIKADARTKSVPVVVLTASDRGRDLQESRRLGAESYIVKPVNFERFSQTAPQAGLSWALLRLTAPMLPNPA
jgi:CheY-like chemotaxis protein